VSPSLTSTTVDAIPPPPVALGYPAAVRPDLDLVQIARRVLLENGFAPDEPPGLNDSIPAEIPVADIRDLTNLAWSSIDNEESRDLDQIEVAEPVAGGDSIRVRIGIADVDAFVPKGSPVDLRAAANTTSLYTGVKVFPMLPEVLSTDRTSLLPDVEHLAVVTEMVVLPDGTIDDAETRLSVARVKNHAKLVYERVGAWLEGDKPRVKDPRAPRSAEHAAEQPPDKRIADQVHLQDEVARRLRRRRHELGALELETIEARPVTKDGAIVDLQVTRKNRARNLIEDLMIAANGATARYLEQRGRSSIRRVVRTPKRWDRIVELARDLGTELPIKPSAFALNEFLEERRAADPVRFPEVSLTVVKLLGPGEYALQRASDPDTGHFGLAVDDYMHSTAPNRRYPDLVTQRLLKAAARDARSPYTDDELAQVAAHCTERENAARKVERTMRKVVAATFLSSRIGEVFDAIVTGVADKGTFVRLIHPAAEGRVVRGERGLDVGDTVRVRLLDTEPERGFIDFARV
jgi:exoribonuclease-2